MKPAPFDYVRPASLDAALEAMAEHGEEARPLAGGQSLIPLLAMRLARPAWLVDLADVPEMRRLEVQPEGARIGAMTTLSLLERDGAFAAAQPLLAAAIPHIGHFPIRNRGTLGGSTAHLDPAAEIPALLLLLNARARVHSRRGERELTMAEFIRGPLTSALEPDELLVEVAVPWVPGSGWGFAEVARRDGDFAMVGAAAIKPPQGPLRLVVFAAGGTPQRLLQAEQTAGDEPAAVERVAAGEIEATSDIHASAAYRRVVGARLAARVVRQAASADPGKPN